jgi:hypothetical protein
VAKGGSSSWMDGTSRVNREAQARSREGLGVQVPEATRPIAEGSQTTLTSRKATSGF